MSYREFKKKGKQSLPDDLYRDLAWEIRNHFLEVELIVAGFIDHESVILKLSSEKVLPCDHFAVIGTGAVLAEGSLFNRQHSTVCGLELALYRAYEAKRLAERAPGVGGNTGIEILHDTNGGAVVDMVHPQIVLPLLAKRFRKFGPKEVTFDNLKLKPLPRDAFFRIPGSIQEWTRRVQSRSQPSPE